MAPYLMDSLTPATELILAEAREGSAAVAAGKQEKGRFDSNQRGGSSCYTAH